MITFDTNVLVYAVDFQTPEKHRRARQLIRLARDADVILAAQVLGEFVNAIRRRKPSLAPDALAQARRFATLFPVISTSADHIIAAAEFAERFKLQFWDSLIWQVTRSAGAAFFVTEDMQDGLSLEGMTVVNPFSTANEHLLRQLLSPIEGSTT